MTEILVADSFLTKSHKNQMLVTNFEDHITRFILSVNTVLGARELSRTDQRLTLFLDLFVEELNVYSADAFPRLECWVENQTKTFKFNFLIRPAPTLQQKLIIVETQVNNYPMKEIKGPNINNYATLNRVNEGETLLVDSNGSVLETTTASLVWWEKDVLNFVDTLERVQSVTEQAVQQIAEMIGIQTAAKPVTQEQLQETETWALNSLHGIRLVKFKHKNTPEILPSERLLLFQAEYAKLASPIKRVD